MTARNKKQKWNIQRKIKEKKNAVVIYIYIYVYVAKVACVKWRPYIIIERSIAEKNHDERFPAYSGSIDKPVVRSYHVRIWTPCVTDTVTSGKLNMTTTTWSITCDLKEGYDFIIITLLSKFKDLMTLNSPVSADMAFMAWEYLKCEVCVLFTRFSSNIIIYIRRLPISMINGRRKSMQGWLSVQPQHPKFLLSHCAYT